MDSITIVMYHYVRPIVGSDFPGIKGLELSEFCAQIQRIKTKFNVIDPNTFVEYLFSNEELPKNSIMLTFDDGYLDHYKYVFPVLSDLNISSYFFPPVNAVKNRQILDVNKIHLILASLDNPCELANKIDEYLVSDYGFNSGQVNTLRKQFLKKYGLDSAEVIYAKRLLQHALPLDVRKKLIDSLFAEVVTDDEYGLADELYVNQNQLKEMVSAGNMVGCHGVSHSWLNTLDEDEQRNEISGSLEFIKNIGVKERFYSISYPFGGYDDVTFSILREASVKVGFLSRGGVFENKERDFLKIPRIDVVDLKL